MYSSQSGRCKSAASRLNVQLLLIAVLIVFILILIIVLVLIFVLILVVFVFVFVLIVLHNCLRMFFVIPPNYKIIICRSVFDYYIKRYFSSTSSFTRCNVRVKTQAKVIVSTNSKIHDISATMLSEENIHTLKGPLAAASATKKRHTYSLFSNSR